MKIELTVVSESAGVISVKCRRNQVEALKRDIDKLIKVVFAELDKMVSEDKTTYAKKTVNLNSIKPIK